MGTGWGNSELTTVSFLSVHTLIHTPLLPIFVDAVVETAEAWAQAECDPDMALRTLDAKAQGFPERCDRASGAWQACVDALLSLSRARPVSVDLFITHETQHYHPTQLRPDLPVGARGGHARLLRPLRPAAHAGPGAWPAPAPAGLLCARAGRAPATGAGTCVWLSLGVKRRLSRA